VGIGSKGVSTRRQYCAVISIENLDLGLQCKAKNTVDWSIIPLQGSFCSMR
jgi:hypothetical protein